MKILGSFLASY